MFNDEAVVTMISEYGFVTTMNFFIYGEITLKDADMLSLGIIPKMLIMYEREWPYIVLIDYVNEDDARTFNMFQGTKMTFIFGGEVPNKEVLAEHIGSGITFLRFKYDYLGAGRCEDGV
jgi:hypothetical protein